jgi:hypothetical protein
MHAQSAGLLIRFAGLAAASRSQQEGQHQIDVESSRQSFHSGPHKTATREQSKDTYGQTIQQSRKSKTPEELPQTQTDGGENEKSREVQTRGLSAALSGNQSAIRTDGLFVFARFLKFFKNKLLHRAEFPAKNR